MFEVLRARWLASAIAFAGVVSQSRADSPVAYKPDQHIIVRVGSKGDRRCVVVAVRPQPDGTVEYQMKAIDNGEVMTIYDRPGSGAARPAPVVTNTPKPSVSNDPLLASTLRQSTGVSVDPPKTAETAVAAAPKKDGPLHRVQELISRTPKATEAPVAGSPAVVIVTRNSQRSPASVPADMILPPETTATAMSGGIPAARNQLIPVSTAGKAVASGEPVPMNMVRNAGVPGKSADPVPLGFVIPVSNSETTPKAKRYEREERIVALGEKLKNALQPSSRENAAESLTEGVGADSAAVRSLLLTAAANDPSANVRATCVRCLVKIGVKDTPLLALLAAGKQDPDVRVRIEIDRAEEMLK